MLNELISMLPKSADGVLIVSETNRRYFTAFPSSDGILLATRNGSVFLTDSRYIEEAQNTVKCCEVQELKKVSEQLPELCKKFGSTIINERGGLDRVALAFLVDAYDEETLGEGDVRVVLHLHPALAPVKAAILPLSKKLSEKALELYDELAKYFPCDFDETGSIGKRYRRQDEIGTPLCVTYDFDSEVDGCVTVRDRDTMEQVRIPISELKSYIETKIAF